MRYSPPSLFVRYPKEILEFGSTNVALLPPYPTCPKALGPIIAIVMGLNQLGKRERVIRDFDKNVQNLYLIILYIFKEEF